MGKHSIFKRKEGEVSLENRLLSGLCLFAAITSFLTILANFLTDVYPLLNVLVGVCGVVFIVFLYFSYSRGVYKSLLIPTTILILFCLVSSWLFYGGFGGATPYFFLVTLPALVFVYPNRGYKTVFFVFVILSMLLLFVQYAHSEWVHPYSTEESWLTDMMVGFLVAITILGFAALVFKKALNDANNKTEQRKSELERSEARFKDIATMSGEWIWELDSEGKFLYCSERVEAITGYQPPEMLGHAFFEYLSKDKEQITRDFKQKMRTKPSQFEQIEHWCWSKSGNLVCILSSGKPLFDEAGILKGFRGVSVDVTLKKSEEESNALKQHFLDTLMDNIPDSIYFKDRESRFLRINKAQANRFKLMDPDEAIGKTDADFFSVEHAAEAYQDEQRIMRSGVPIITKEEQELWSDKPSTWVSTTKMPLMFDAGKIIGTFGISRDITESKHMQQAIEKRILALTRPLSKDDNIDFSELFDLENIQRIQDQFASLFGVASIITDTSGKPITKPSNFTRFCTDLVRTTEKGCMNCELSDAALGRPNMGGPTVRPCLSSGLWDAGTSIFVGDSHIANWLIGQIRDENHSLDDIRAYARQIGADEQLLVEAFLEVPSMKLERFKQIAEALYALAGNLSNSAYQNLQQARFITERKQAEDTLRENAIQLKNLNATKDRFFSIIAHDLRSPFNSILGFAELLHAQISENNMDKALDFCRIIEDSARNTMELLNNLLDWSRTQTDKIPFTPRRLSLNQLITESLLYLKPVAQHKNIRIQYDVSEMAFVVADAQMLSAIIRNLTSNAIKFTSIGGAVSVSVQERDVDWLVSVSDNGVGMSPETLDKLFRIDSNISTNGTMGEHGTGLGLILCKEFVHMHKGIIYADSELGKGSTLHFTLSKSIEESNV